MTCLLHNFFFNTLIRLEMTGHVNSSRDLIKSSNTKKSECQFESDLWITNPNHGHFGTEAMDCNVFKIYTECVDQQTELNLGTTFSKHQNSPEEKKESLTTKQKGPGQLPSTQHQDNIQTKPPCSSLSLRQTHQIHQDCSRGRLLPRIGAVHWSTRANQIQFRR